MNRPTGVVFDIKRFSIHDGPGIRTTVFFKGCPLNCRWCHNPESQASEPEMVYWENRCIRCGACREACNQGAIKESGGMLVADPASCNLCGACVDACYADARQIVGQRMTVAQVLAEVERDVAFYDESGGGVTFSGGEPLAQWEFLVGLLQACGQQEIHRAVDTCGYAEWAALDAVRRHTDLFLYDLKVIDDDRHRQLTGVSNERILGNLKALSRRGDRVVLRVPIIPGLNDDEENIRQIAEFAAALPHLTSVDLLPYHAAASSKYERLNRAYQLQEIRSPSREALHQTAGILEASGLQVKIGG